MSSKRGIRRKMCDGKKRHPDLRAAKEHCWKLRKKDNEPMRPYKCKFCKGYHSGHYQPGRGR